QCLRVAEVGAETPYGGEAPSRQHLLFFFQAEDGIRDGHVTGVQTCALPISWTDNVTKTTGPHVVKFGVFFDYNQAGQQPATQETPVFTFASQGNNSFVSDTNNGVANLVLGNYFNVTQGNGIFFGAFRFHQFEMYGQ